MKRKHFLAAVSVALVLAATLVTAGSQATTTPLYMVRMEQQSNKMNFLPTAVTEFTYTTESGVILGMAKGYVGESLITGEPFCYLTDETCKETCYTCKATCYTCSTCSSTCGYTCGCSCGFTCDTCIATCGTTCNPTCDAITCDSCIQTCITCSSCSLTCSTC
jgi:hypothetical protein